MADTADPTPAAGGSNWLAPENLFDLYDRMLGAACLPDVLSQIGETVTDAFQAAAASIYLVRRDTWELEAHVRVHNVPRTIHVPIDKTSLAGFCATTSRAFRVPDAYGDLSFLDPEVRFDRSWDTAHGFRTRDILCAPALFKGEVVGVIQVLNSRSGSFSAADLQALRTLARVVGYALYHARLCDDFATMKHLQREKAKYMSVMVHEFKSPVAAARMLTDLLHRGMIAADERDEYLQRILARLDALQELITDSLELAKIESGDVLGEVAEIDLGEQVAAVVADYREPLEAKGLSLDLRLARDIRVRFDIRGLNLALSNLISNAVKYTEEGTITVTVAGDDDVATVAVADSGIGIPEKDIPDLFKEYFRASNARQSRIEGTGVGLAAVRGIVERFSGELRLETRENVGSTFTLRIPRAAVGAEAAEE